MAPETRRLVLIWLATTAAVAIAALVAYSALARVPELAGRTDPEVVLTDPEALFADPGLIGTAVEISVTREIAACMAARGFTYRGPAAIDGLDDLLDPATDGYGIATGPAGGEVLLGDGGASRYERDAYEQALYGTTLDGGGTTGGCVAAGRAELQRSLETIENLPYSIEELERNAAAHPAMVTGLAEWSDCMRRAGYDYAAPEEILADLAERLASASPEEARALVAEERRIAVADFACRDRHLAAAESAVAAALAPEFIEANQSQLESLMPPPPIEPGVATVPTGLGTGDVQVTLLWFTTADLDLQVTDTAGVPIDYNRRESSQTGGRLDVDANRGCSGSAEGPVENVYWPEGGGPRGDYGVRVTMWSACGATLPFEFTVIIQLDGRVVVNDTVSTDRLPWTTEFRY